MNSEPESGGVASLHHLKSAAGAALGAIQLQETHPQNVPAASAPSAKTLTFQIPCAAIGAAFAAADAGSMILASLLGQKDTSFLFRARRGIGRFHVGAGVTAALVYVLIGRSSGFYQAADIFSLRKSGPRILWQWLLTSLSLALLAFLFRIGIKFSRGSIICFAVLALTSLFASRNLMKAALNWAVRQGRVQGRRVVVVGLRDELAAVRVATCYDGSV